MSTDDQISELLHEAYDLRISDIPKSIRLASEALALSREHGMKRSIARSYSHLSLFHMILGEYDDALNLAKEAINRFEDLGDEWGMADAMYNIAGVYYKTNSFHTGLIYLIDSLAIFQKHNDYHNQARVLKSLGTIFEYFGDQARAIQAYEGAVDCSKKVGDLKLESNAYNPLSGIYLNRNQPDMAMEIIERSIAMKEETGDIRGLAFALYGRGKVYAAQEKFDLAEADYMKSLEIHTEMGEKLGRGMTLNKLGALYLDKGELKKAYKYTYEALEFSSKSQTAFIKYKAHYQLYLIAKKENKPDEALVHLENHLDEKEHVINSQTHKIIEAYQSISEKQKLEAEASTHREKAEIIEKKNRELDSFFYKVSHDLKGPISSIMGFDSLLREEIRDPKALKYFDIYRKQVARINNILDELMRISRIDHYSDKKEEIDFNHLINDCIHSLSFLPNYEKVQFNVNVDEGITYFSEWSSVNSILQNLVENAIKYADVSKEVQKACISVTQYDNKICIEAQDNGIGMEQTVTDKIFDMFYKANDHAEGSGLGLYILNRAVEKLQGKVEIESTLGEGSHFKVILPYH